MRSHREEEQRHHSRFKDEKCGSVFASDWGETVAGEERGVGETVRISAGASRERSDGSWRLEGFSENL